MNAGLLFYQAHRTALCQQTVERQLQKLDFTDTQVQACTKPHGLCRALASLLNHGRMVTVISGTSGGSLACSVPIFESLHIPLDEFGEPKHVRRLCGKESHGYLIESHSQAVLLVPDLPTELESMLPAAAVRLAYKFGKELPPEAQPVDYEALAELSFKMY